MNRNILIVEDNIEGLKALAEITKRSDNAGAVFCASDSACAYKYAMEEDIDLFMIDIILDAAAPGDVSGMVFADRIRKIERYSFTPIIFITSLIDQQMNAFHKLHCCDYIEKPYDEQRVRAAIERALKAPLNDDSQKDIMYYKKDGVIYAVNTDEIKYIEIISRKVVIATINEKIEIPYMNNRQLLKGLPRKYFSQCSRNTIVNKRHIEYIDKANQIIKLKGDDRQISIGGKMKKKFLEEL